MVALIAGASLVLGGHVGLVQAADPGSGPAPAAVAVGGADAGAAVERASGQAARSASLRVLVAHPVVYGLASQLLAGDGVAGIELVQVAPPRLPAGRIPAYLAGRGLDSLQAEAQTADAVLSLRSVWPDDQLYALARRANIRVVEIDVANPVEGDLPGLTVAGEEASDDPARGQGVLARQPWQDAANLARMAALISDGLGRLRPAAAPGLQQAQSAISRRLQQAEAEVNRRLAGADDVSVLMWSPRLQTLATSLQLEPVGWQAPKAAAELPQALQARLSETGVKLVLSHTALPKAAAEVVEAAGVKVVVLSENAPDPVGALIGAMQTSATVLTGR
ncbi:MAG: zinc ABC transporter substrate-binding protein [Lautropia sp.]|nr:zinc ABC transporter substrate-binding protein [Lautropia sp.]